MQSDMYSICQIHCEIMIFNIKQMLNVHLIVLKCTFNVLQRTFNGKIQQFLLQRFQLGINTIVCPEAAFKCSKHQGFPVMNYLATVALNIIV